MGAMRDFEETAATIVETVLDSEESRSLGVRRRRDGLDATSLLVDFTYEDAVPRVALEVTTVQDDSFLSAASAARKLADRLNEAVQREQIQPYRITVSEWADMRRIEGPLLKIMRTGQGITPGAYSSAELAKWDAAGTLQTNLEQHRALKSLGVGQVLPAPGDGAVSVSTWGESEGGWAPAKGLEDVAFANIDKLRAVGPHYETHMMIGIGRYRVSQDAERTLVPALPEGLDRLWLVHLWQGARGRQVWSVRQHQDRWQVHHL